MRAALYWPDCELLDPEICPTAFWVECSPEEAARISPELAPEHRLQQAHHPTWPLCFLVSQDGQQIRADEFIFPFSGMWNGASPFLAMQPHEIGTLTELQALQITPAPWVWPLELQG